jgi:Domain of unknown function (DUF4386)
VVWVFLALTLYRLLKHVNKGAANAMVVLATMGAGITMLNALFEFEGLRVATGAVNLAAFGAAGSNALALLLVDTQHYGLLIASIFMGLWLMPLGYLAYKSRWFPKALGAVLILGGACAVRASTSVMNCFPASPCWNTRALVEDNDVRAPSAHILQSRRKVLFGVPVGPPRIADDPTYAANPQRVEFGDLTIE